MRHRAIATATVLLALTGAAAAEGARVNVLNQEHLLRSPGPTIWDVFQNSSTFDTCSGVSGGAIYSPVGDGLTFAGHGWRYDGFDFGAIIGVEGAVYSDSDGNVVAKGNSVTTDPRATGGLSVGRTDTALQSGPTLRSLIRLRNPGGSAFTGTVTLASNLGSDGGPEEAVRATASGDPTLTTADRWLVSSEVPPLSAYDDPAITHALFGKGAAVTSSTIVDSPAPGSGCLTVDFDVSIPAGKTRYLLFFTEMYPQPGQAESRAGRYDKRGLSSPLLKGIAGPTRKQILNWDLNA